MSAVVAYPSGFVGYDVGWPVQRESATMDRKIAALRVSAISQARDKLSIVNLSIETLFGRYLEDKNLLRSPEFICDLTAVAANAFGTDNFYNWCYAQEKSQYFCATQREFMNDLFLFIQKGERRVALQRWPALLSMRLATPEDARTPYHIREFFKSHPNVSVVSVITTWLSQPFGAEDMLYTLRILFGPNN